MLIRKKNSKKDLILELQQIQKENAELKKQLNSKDNLSLSDLLLFFQADKIDLILFDSAKNSLSLLDASFTLSILKELPSSLEEFVSYLGGDDNEQIDELILHLDIKGTLKRKTKISISKDHTKETKPIELVAIRESENKFIFAIRDISDALKQERELQKVKEKVEESDKLKTTLLSNISHQIRTPLNSITGFSELIAGAESSNIKKKEYIEIIKRQSKRILNLIDDLSEVTKLETGSINISKTPCNLKLLFNELLLGINQQRNPKRKDIVELNLVLPEEDIDFLTDSGRLQQALINIISYSLKHTQLGKVDFGYTLSKDDNKLTFFISDTSEGLSKEEQKVIFNRFMSLENNEGTKFEDPGLGLTIAQYTIKALGGKIAVESNKNEGTTFTFSLPYEKVVKEESIDLLEKEVPDAKNYSWANKVILIVDDEDVNAIFLDAVFQITGVQLLFAKNGLQALELVKNINKIDLILMDIKMPVMNGIKATAEIRKINRNIPIIAQTALASEEDMEATIKAGCNTTITKPIEVDELLSLVNTFLSE